MSTRRINGIQLEKMIRNGLANLEASETEVNRLNVFPVADGDTGTNMCLTLANGLNSSKSHKEACHFLKELSEGMLLGARGNSGVILSQLFRGMWLELSRHPIIGPGEMRNCLIRAYRVAYEAVVTPVEGTILTVAREGIEHIRSQIRHNTGIDTLLSMYIAEMRKTLAYTPEMLDVLKESGVIDSGALGYILICEGMLKYLYGDVISQDTARYERSLATVNPMTAVFDENSVFEDGYCMEYVLQLMATGSYNQRFHLPSYIDDLRIYGNSLVVIQEGMKIKVHIHTKKPAKVISLSQEFGEFINFKLENMQLQHNEHAQAVSLTKSQQLLSTVAVVNGAGMRQCFENLGCAVLIEGGTTMNPSAEDFLEAFKKCGSQTIAVLPDNANAILAAEQAAKLFNGSARIEILYSRSMVEGYFALAMDVADSTDTEYRLRQMKSGIKDVLTMGQTVATRDCSGQGIMCSCGDNIVVIRDEVIAKGDNAVSAIIAAFDCLPDMNEKESCILFKGNETDLSEEELIEAINEKWPLLEVTCENGGQQLYGWLIGLT